MTTSVTGPSERRPEPDSQGLERDVARAPELRGRRRQERLGQLDDPADELARPAPERELGAPSRAEQVGDERQLGAAHAGEEERRAAGRDHAAVDLGGLEPRIDFGVDDTQLAEPPQLVQKGAQVGESEVAVAHSGTDADASTGPTHAPARRAPRSLTTLIVTPRLRPGCRHCFASC